MSLLLQDIVVTSVAVAIAVGAVVRVVRWTRADSEPACSNCNACADRAASRH